MKKNSGQNRRKSIDPIDCRMIELLQRDGRVSNTEIAKTIGISEATVRTRLQRLIREEYIQIVAVSNPLKLGFKVVGTIRIHVEIKKMDKIIHELKAIKALWHIVQTTGGTGIDTEFVLKSLDELNALIFEKINRIDGVLRTETSLFLNYVKRQYDWGTALEWTERDAHYTPAHFSKTLAMILPDTHSGQEKVLRVAVAAMISPKQTFAI